VTMQEFVAPTAPRKWLIEVELMST
jgi:hypothetical protein